MKTLVIRTPEVVGNPDNFKKIGHNNIGYTANLAEIDPTKPPIFGISMGAGVLHNTTITIEGATIYKVGANGATINFGTTYDSVVNFTDAEGPLAIFAFIPTKEKGFIRISNDNGLRVKTFYFPALANDAVSINIEPSELKRALVAFEEIDRPAGYSQTLKLTGDINDFAKNESLQTLNLNGYLKSVSSDFNNNIWSEKLQVATKSFAVGYSKIKADIDMGIFTHAMTYVDIRSNMGITLFGDMTKALNVAGVVLIKDNYSHQDVTGSLNGLSTGVKRVDIQFPNIGGGYTSRTYTWNIEAMVINAPKVPATDYDLLLSDLANSPAVQSTYIALSKRTSASDGSVASLVARGCTVVIG